APTPGAGGTSACSSGVQGGAGGYWIAATETEASGLPTGGYFVCTCQLLQGLCPSLTLCHQAGGAAGSNIYNGTTANTLTPGGSGSNGSNGAGGGIGA